MSGFQTKMEKNVWVCSGFTLPLVIGYLWLSWFFFNQSLRWSQKQLSVCVRILPRWEPVTSICSVEFWLVLHYSLWLAVWNYGDTLLTNHRRVTKSVYHVVFSLAFIPEFCFLRCCCCCFFCVFRDWFGSTQLETTLFVMNKKSDRSKHNES